MKKMFLAMVITVAVVFTAAVGLCVQTLSGARAVSTFADGGMRIVLDAGHGGIDGGVTGIKTGIKESDLNLSIVMKLKDALADMGFEVILTRKTDAGLYGTAAKGFKRRDMERRKEIIEEADPMLVLSIHQNFYPSSSTRGGQVFYRKKDERCRRLAQAMQLQLNGLYAEHGAKGRNIMAGEYFMLECSSAPSVIVECGFLSNEKDEALLVNENWQKTLAERIAAGVIVYLSDAVA